MRSEAVPFTVHAFADGIRLGRALARHACVPFSQISLHRFPDAESLVTVRSPAAHAVLVRSLFQPNAKLVEVLLAADALRRAGARRVTLVAPYLPYMRQDAVFRPGQPLSQEVIGALLGRTFDALLTVEAHLHRTASLARVINRRARSLSAAPLIAAWVRRHCPRDAIVVGPDAESVPMVRAVAFQTGRPWAVGTKERRGDRSVRVRIDSVPPGRSAVLVDDIASSGGTLIAAARAVRAHGVRCTTAVIVHALFAGDARARLRAAGLTTIVTTDTVPDSTNAIGCAPFLADALRGARLTIGLDQKNEARR